MMGQFSSKWFSGKRFSNLLFSVLLLVPLGAQVSACGSDSENIADAVLEIIGAYADDFGTVHTITADTWISDYSGDVSTFHIQSYSNETDHMVVLNDEANAYNAGLYSRFDWTESGGDLYFCTAAYDAATAQAAEEADSADRTDPATVGCAGYSWSKLTSQ